MSSEGTEYRNGVLHAHLRCPDCGLKAGTIPLEMADSLGVDKMVLRGFAEGSGDYTLTLVADVEPVEADD